MSPTSQRQLALAVIGPTASGKTAFAVELATLLNGEVVCMDSTTVYRGFDIGSSKATAEERAKVPHHLLDILNPAEPFSAHHFVEIADETISEIHARGKIPIVVGGTYFYLKALQHGMYSLPVISEEAVEKIEREFFEDEVLNTGRMHEELKTKDPTAAENIHPNDRYRLLRALAILRETGELPSKLKPVKQSDSQKTRLWLKYAMLVSRHALSASIVKRTEKMLAAGIVEETKALHAANPTARALGSVGYAESLAFLNKKITEKQLRNEIIEKTRQLAKRQITWLRSDSEIRYVDLRDVSRVALEVGNLREALGGTK